MLAGVGVFVFGHNMAEKAAMGQSKISSAEQQVQDQRRPVFGPVRKEIREQKTEQAQQKIYEQEPLVAQSEVSATWYQGTGIVLFLAGMTVLVFALARTNKA